MPKSSKFFVPSIILLFFGVAVLFVFFIFNSNKSNFSVEASPSLIAAPTFTGLATTDFAALPGVFHFTDGAGDVGIDPGMVPQRTGWDMRDVYMYYDVLADKMYIGVHCSFICGDVDGDGNPAAPSAQWLGVCGTPACDSDWGIGENFGFFLDMNNTGNYDVAVGKPRGTVGLGGWRIQHTAMSSPALGASAATWNLATVGTFGTGLIANTTTLISQNHDMEFSIDNFSTMPGFTGGPIRVSAFIGSNTDAGNGEDNTISPAPFTLPAVISGHVKEDTNHDGTGDVCINGTTIELYDSTGTILMQTTTTVASVTVPAGETCYYEFQPVQPGTYVIKEVQPTGFVNVSTTAGTTDFSNVTGVAGVDVITTTVVSTDISPNNDFVEEKPFLTVTKVVVNDNGGTKVVSDFPLKVGATTVTSGVSNQFDTGAYVVSETNQPGYTSTISGDCDTSGNVTLDNSRNASGNAWSCTITNDDIPSHLSAIKIVINDNGGTIPATGFALFDNGSSITTGVSNIVNPGSHTVSETLQSGYTQVSIVCVDDATGGTVANPVILAQGQSVTCTITNDDNATLLTVKKVVVNDNAGTKVIADFPLFVDGNPVTSGTQITTTAGTHTVTETLQTGYSQTSLLCKNDLTNTIVAHPVVMAQGDSVTCTVTNDDIPPTLTVTKVVVNDNGGTKVVSDFPLLINGVTVTSGTANNLNAGVGYTVSETAQPGYAQTSLICTDNANGAAVTNPMTLALDQDVTCVITNNDIAPTIKVTKVVVNDNGGTKVISDFPLLINATTVTSGTVNTETAGVAYTVSETAQAGYAQTSIACTDDATGSTVVDPMTLVLDQDVSCVITNDDIAPTLTVTKVVVNDNGGTKLVADFPLFVNATSVTSGTANTESAGVAYTVSETAQAGYTQTSLVCKDNATAATIANPVTLALDQDVTCSITNDDVAPTLTVTKIVVNDNGGTKVVSDFALTINATAVTSGTANNELANTALTVAETTLAGYTQTSLVCKDNATGGTVTNPVTLAPAQNVTCTITNDDIQPLLTVTKIVTNNNGGTKVVTDFPLKVGATTVTSGTQAGFNAATYIVSETTSTDYQSTITGDCNAAGSITLSVGDVKACTITNNDYPNLGDYVWTDANADGIQDATETGINGVTVNLYCSGNATALSTTTTVNNPVGGKPGYYQFQHLNPATCNYIVEFVKPAGSVITTKDNPVSDLTDSDADPTTGKTIPITMVMDQDQEFWDAGIYTPVKLGDFVWTDTNADGIQDATETDTSCRTGAVVKLTTSAGAAVTDASGVTVANQTTTNTGAYLFTNLVPGIYKVTFTAPAGSGCVFTSKDTATTTDLLDSDADRTAGATTNITMVSGIDQLTWDAGLYKPVKLGDFVWTDTNADGIQDATETDTSCRTGAIVKLSTSAGGAVTDASGVAVANQTTTNTGAYLFTNLTPGVYVVTFTAPAGCVFTNKDTATTTDLLDSDADRTTGATTNITMVSGVDQLTWDAGLYIPAKLGDYVWQDTNNNGKQEASETLTTCRTGVVVALTTSTGGAVTDASGVAVNSQTTTNTGAYLFTNLVPGSYIVKFTAPPASGCIFTKQDAATTTDLLDSDADLTTGKTTTITLVSGDNQLQWDAGLWIPACIGNYIWLDLNLDGKQDATEKGVPALAVSLNLPDGTTQQQLTDADGKYLFCNLPAGDYTVQFPTGLLYTTKDAGADDTVDSDVDTTTGITPTISLLNGVDQLQWDAGLILQKIGDYVWKDSNADGKQDNTEKGINGILVTLTDCNGLELSTTTTATNPTTLVDGYYEFYIDPGTYCVKITKPTDLVRTKQDQGTDDTVDSDIDKNYTTKPIILKPAINQPQWDAGLVEPACIGDRIYEDLNANGLEDAGEPGIPNAVVTLLLPDGTKQDKTADATGTYYFCDLTPDTYTVSIDLTQPALVNYPDFGFGYEKTSPQTVTKTLNPLDFYKLADFGYLPYAKLGDRVFIDHDKNCVFDGSDTGVSGVKLNLYDSAGNLLKSTTTDSTGTYSFTVAANLVYRVEVDSSWKTNSAILGDSDTCGLTKTSPIMKPNQNYIDLDFGFVPPPVANTGADYSLMMVGLLMILGMSTIVIKKYKL